MPEHIDKEIEAIKSILLALEPLPAEIRASVLGYVIRRLQIVLTPAPQKDAASIPDATLGTEKPVVGTQAAPVHIKVFKDEKKPRSANEMAALVAYYLANLAPKEDRKDKITSKEIETYFKIAEFPLVKTQFTLPNARAAGYLDAAGSGEYKLNAVGHNLVVHSMPRGEGRIAARKKPAKKAGRTAKKR